MYPSAELPQLLVKQPELRHLEHLIVRHHRIELANLREQVADEPLEAPAE
jgi:hypothetical protein